MRSHGETRWRIRDEQSGSLYTLHPVSIHAASIHTDSSWRHKNGMNERNTYNLCVKYSNHKFLMFYVSVLLAKGWNPLKFYIPSSFHPPEANTSCLGTCPHSHPLRWLSFHNNGVNTRSLQQQQQHYPSRWVHPISPKLCDEKCEME